MTEVAVAGAKRGCVTVLATLLVLALLAGGVAAWLWHDHQRFADTPLATEAPSVVVAKGDSLRAVLRKLRQAGITAGHDGNWLLLARQVGAAGHIKVGEYALQPAVSPRELLERMRQGKVIQYRFTIVEGWNIRQLRAAINAASPLQHAAADLDDAALMARLGFPGQHPEGRFLPETYLYQRGDSDLDVLARSHKAMEAALAQAWANRADDGKDAMLEPITEQQISDVITTARAIGDDKLSGSNSDGWTHGSSAQRVRWFSTGYQSGSPKTCDTFATDDL